MTLTCRRLFQIALLRGRQIVIDNQHVGLERFRQLFEFFHLAVTEQRGRIHIRRTEILRLPRSAPGADAPALSARERFRRRTPMRRRGGVRSRQGSPSRGLLQERSLDLVLGNLTRGSCRNRPCAVRRTAAGRDWPRVRRVLLNGCESITTVEIACLKINCSWLLVSSTREYLSKLLIRPESLTPLRR